MRARRLIGRAIQRASASWRPLPDFLIIGGIRCGTTSLIHYLGEHPSIGVSSIDEVHYFDWHHDEGERWYRSWFPMGTGSVTGESSPSYLMNGLVPERVAELLPDAKLIVLVRDPVDRAISHFHMRRIRGREVEPTLEQAIRDEPRRMEQANHRSERFGGRIDCYVHQGSYAVGLRRWMEHFPREQFHIVRSEDLFSQPTGTYGGVLEFLGVAPHDLAEYRVHNAADYQHGSDVTTSELAQRFRPLNEEFFHLTGVRIEVGDRGNSLQ